MKLEYDNFEKILNIGIKMSTEQNRNRLLVSILESGMDITHCDASTLYLYNKETLTFKIMKTLSMGISRGEHGEPIDDIPPVPLREENICAYAAIHREIVNIPDVYHSGEFDFSGPKNYDAMTGYHTESMLVVPVENHEGELIGVLQLMNAQDEDGKVIAFDKAYHIIIRSLASLAAITLTNLQYMEEIKEQLHSFVQAMATAIDERTPYNGSHTRKVAEYSGILAEYINQKHALGKCEDYFDENRLEQLMLAALLHDIGKMIVPLSVMNRATRLDKDIVHIEKRFTLLRAYYEIDYLKDKCSKEVFEKNLQELDETLKFIHEIDSVGFLNDENYEKVQRLAAKTYVKEDGTQIPYITEYERNCLSIRKGTLTEDTRRIMESHVEMTAKILDKVHFNKNYQNVPKWASSHHEFLDGSGYPNHLTANELDLETRILTIADIYDALTARDRPYKKPLPKDTAINILQNMAKEGKLDIQLVEWLNEALEKGEKE